MFCGEPTIELLENFRHEGRAGVACYLVISTMVAIMLEKSFGRRFGRVILGGVGHPEVGEMLDNQNRALVAVDVVSFFWLLSFMFTFYQI